MFIKRKIRDVILKLRGEPSIAKLKKMGLRIGENYDIQAGCILDYAHCWLISIGNDVTLAPRVHILAHDASTKRHIGYAKIGTVEIGNKVFVGANSTILPNVTIGDNSIIGCNSVVTTSIPPNSVAVGNPARVISSTEEYIGKHQRMIREKPVYDDTYTVRKKISTENKVQMIKEIKDIGGYVD